MQILLNKLRPTLRILTIILLSLGLLSCLRSSASKRFLKRPKRRPPVTNLDKKTQKFLQVISQLESSGGQNVDHTTMKSGIHANDAAFGSYGLMPNTIQDVAKRLSRLNKLDPDTQPLETLDKEQYGEYLRSNPVAEQKVADFLARNLLARMGGDELRSAYAWHNGSNLQPQDITDETLQNHFYPQRYKALSTPKAPNVAKEAKQKAIRKLSSSN